MDFKIREQESIDYEAIKQAYLDGVRGNRLRKMFGLGTTAYVTLLKDFRNEGIEVKRGCSSKKKESKYYHRNICKGKFYWCVTRWIDGELHYYGQYKSKAEAEKRVEELKLKNWEE